MYTYIIVLRICCPDVRMHLNIKNTLTRSLASAAMFRVADRIVGHDHD